MAGLAGYDANQIILEAYSIRQPGESLKPVIRKRNDFQGAQQPLSIDPFGDADHQTVIVVIRDKQYVTVE